MPSPRLILPVLVLALLTSTPRASAQRAASAGIHIPTEVERFHDDYIAARLQLGLRVSYFQLIEDTEENFAADGEFTGGFLGTISNLEEQQSLVPTPYLRYLFTPYFGAAVGWEHFELRTRTFRDGNTDGDYIYSGPSFHLEGRFPNVSPATPYASIGYALLNGEVDYNPDWHRDGLRNFFMKDTTAFILSAGSQFEINDRFALDLFFNYLNADFDVEYKLALERRSRGEFEFPLDNWSVGLTALWTF